MNDNQAGILYARINAIWPVSRDLTTDEVREWMYFLRPLDNAIAEGAILELRGQLTFRPSMADFRAAYKKAAADPAGDALGLPAGPKDPNAPDNLDLYGSSMDDWVYCWKCDMAISLEERATTPHYHPGRGLHHFRCPKSGTAPLMPNHLRIERAEWEERRRKKREQRSPDPDEVFA